VSPKAPLVIEPPSSMFYPQEQSPAGLRDFRSWKGRHGPPSTSKLISACIDIGNIGPHTCNSMDLPLLCSLAACETRDLSSSNPYRSALSVVHILLRVNYDPISLSLSMPPPSSHIRPRVPSYLERHKTLEPWACICNEALNGCEQDMKGLNRTRDGLIGN